MVKFAGRVHIVGIGGSGMSALAQLLCEAHVPVSGSDLKGSLLLERLRLQGVDVSVGHQGENVIGADIVAVSTAIPDHNVEIQEARAQGISVWTRAELLRALVEDHRVIAVSGTNGKTTTTAMIAAGLAEAGRSPSYLIGAEVNEAGASGHYGDSDVFVVEADESDGTFLTLNPEIAVVTNVEQDHQDFYGGLAGLRDAFRRFIEGSSLPAVVCADDPGATEVSEGLPRLTYGFSESADMRIENLVMTKEASSFAVTMGGTHVTDVTLSVLGTHNVANATAALAVARLLGADLDRVAEGLSRYVGVSRRFQHRRVIGSIRIIDDYAHLPSEIRATIGAARQLGAKRLVVVFQPHRYSRTQLLAQELGEALTLADEIVVTDIYGAGEDPIPGVSGDLVAAAARQLAAERVHYVPSRMELAPAVAALLSEDDVLLTLGAGDIGMVEGEIGEVLRS